MKRLVAVTTLLFLLLSTTNNAEAATDLSGEITRLKAIVADLQRQLNELLNRAIERAVSGGGATQASPAPSPGANLPVPVPQIAGYPAEPKRSTTTFIDSLEPNTGPVGTVVTIKGRGFATSSSGNTIYASYQVIRGVKSKDGTTLTFTVSAFDNDFAGPDVFKNRPAGRTVRLPLIVAVENNTGISNDMMFTVTYQAPVYEPSI